MCGCAMRLHLRLSATQFNCLGFIVHMIVIGVFLDGAAAGAFRLVVKLFHQFKHRPAKANRFRLRS